jgi:hypothetical protein
VVVSMAARQPSKLTVRVRVPVTGYGDVAQTVERHPEKVRVGGSIPFVSIWATQAYA